MDRVDVVIVGAGVVGLACAAAIAEQGLEVLVLEQHAVIGNETSSRNSEVIHAGIYYPTGSRKAQLCVRGKHKLYEYCAAHQIPHRRCGKLIVATTEAQRTTVQGYVDQARANGVDDLQWLSADQVAAMEPAVRCVGGVYSPSTGIIDSHALMVQLQADAEACGAWVALCQTVAEIEASAQGFRVHVQDFAVHCKWLINAAGLHAPRLLAPNHQMQYQPFYARGHYYAYSGKQPFSRLVYPVAQAGGLGVHVTLDLAGQVKFGPDVEWIDTLDYTFNEARKQEFVQAIHDYFPGVEADRLQPDYTGIRPKLAPAGSAFVDFEILAQNQGRGCGRVDLLGIESPGLTASLAIAEQVRDTVTGKTGHA